MAENQTVYVVVAAGRLSCFSDKNKILSKKCFVKKDDAEAYIEEFRKKCIDPELGSFSALADDSKLKISVISLELIG